MAEANARPLVLFAQLTDLNPMPARQLLAEHGMDAEVMRVDARGSVDPTQRDAVGLIAGYSRIDSVLMDQLPALGIIATSSNGTDMVDIDAAIARGIWVTNVGHAATEEVAVHTLALALASLRGLPEMMATVASGGWTDELQAVPRRASQLTLGVVGYGRIGRRVAHLAERFFGRILVHDPFQKLSNEAVESVTLTELLERAHIVSLHVPLTLETEAMIGEAEFARMPVGSVLINVSRGELIDMPACLKALDSGHLSKVAFDVLVGEPPAADHPLRTHPRAIVTPHAAFLSDAALRNYETDPAQYIADWYETGRPSACVVGDPTSLTS